MRVRMRGRGARYSRRVSVEQQRLVRAGARVARLLAGARLRAARRQPAKKNHNRFYGLTGPGWIPSGPVNPCNRLPGQNFFCYRSDLFGNRYLTIEIRKKKEYVVKIKKMSTIFYFFVNDPRAFKMDGTVAKNKKGNCGKVKINLPDIYNITIIVFLHR